MGDLSKYLFKDEYRCDKGNCKHCGGSLPPDLYDGDNLAATYEMFFDMFDHIRESWGKPIKINSGYRCIRHNQDVGGEPNSVHTFGLALDLDCDTVAEATGLGALVDQLEPSLRIGTYTVKGTFVHIDCGNLIWPRATDKWAAGVRWTG